MLSVVELALLRRLLKMQTNCNRYKDVQRVSHAVQSKIDLESEASHIL